MKENQTQEAYDDALAKVLNNLNSINSKYEEAIIPLQKLRDAEIHEAWRIYDKELDSIKEQK